MSSFFLSGYSALIWGLSDKRRGESGTVRISPNRFLSLLFEEMIRRYVDHYHVSITWLHYYKATFVTFVRL